MAAARDVSNLFIFLIDTKQYAGNFERELCAHVTGRVGDCGVGEELSNIFEQEVGATQFVEDLQNKISFEPDDHGCSRPASLWHTPDGQPHAVAIFFTEKPTAEEIEFMKKRTETFNVAGKKGRMGEFFQPITITGFRLVEKVVTYNELPL